MNRRRSLRVALWGLVWLVVSVPVWVVLLQFSSTTINVAGHDAVVHPTLDGHVVVRMGPYVPDARIASGSRMGAEIVLGKTVATSGPQIVARYAVLAARPQAEVRGISRGVEAMAVTAAARAAAIGLVPLLLWWLLGPERRRQLTRPSRHLAVLASMVAVSTVVVLLAPWRPDVDKIASQEWVPLAQALPSVAVPVELAGVELQGGAITSATSRLVESAFDTYAKSKIFYDQVQERIASVAGELRTPVEDEVVGILVSDRHDNVGMDRVAATIGRAAGATVVLDAGDDTSSGEPWEAFSIDSVAEAFSDYPEKVSIAGNHDHGEFVSKHFRELGWTTLDGEPVTLSGSIRLMGINDPRSSGLGNWRDETGLSFGEVRDRFSTELCALAGAGQRIGTVLVHDANLAGPAVEQGCVDLVVGGHVHTPSGPTIHRGDAGAGYSYTVGTTGGAAYAFAMGSKLRREAMVALITWRDSRPVGIQPVTVKTTGDVVVGGFVPLTY